MPVNQVSGMLVYTLTTNAKRGLKIWKHHSNALCGTTHTEAETEQRSSKVPDQNK